MGGYLCVLAPRANDPQAAMRPSSSPRWMAAADELRSTNAQVEFRLRRALADAGRLASHVEKMRKAGRPRLPE